MKRLLIATVAAVLAALPLLSATPPEVNAADTPHSVVAVQPNLMETLQQTNVTIKSNRSQGSGSLVNRTVDGETVTFVWTAAHVIEDLRSTRNIIDKGVTRTLVEFNDARIVQELVQNGRRVGEIQMDAKVVCYSDKDYGEDLALLMVRKREFLSSKLNTKFYLDDQIPAIGTDLYHVGSLKGQFGANSLTTGVVSQIGRVLNLGNEVVFDQTTVTAFPGSSGGGVYLKADGRYVGMLVRGSGEQFNFIVPIRRMRSFAESAGVLWAIDPSVPTPSMKDILRINIEDANAGAELTPTPAFGFGPDQPSAGCDFLIAPIN